MTKPMYCPMAFYAGEKEWINHNGKLDICTKKMECTPDCAWVDNDGVNYWCGMKPWNIHAKNNTRPLKDDAE